jgi:beta-RFAP synthase
VTARPAIRAVRVTAPARLHLGFLDLAGDLGRRFGSLGLAVDRPRTRLTLEPAARLSVEGPEAERAERVLRKAAELLAVRPAVRLAVEEAIPAHMGFGSGTQLALAVGAALSRLHGRPADAEALAVRLGRGARSAIGVAAFRAGGFLVDGGRGADTAIAPLLARLPFPENWRVLLILDRGHRGLHGAAETSAFRNAPPFGASLAGELCRLTLMQALPGLAERDLARFGAAVSEIQRRLGDYFAAAQGGRFASPKVARVLAGLEAEGVTGLGQTSWGPTGFAFFESEARAEQVRAALAARHRGDPALDFAISRGRNRGAEIEAHGIPAPAGEARPS